MYARSPAGSRASAAWGSNSDGMQVLPENEEKAPPAPVPQSGDLQQQQSQYQHSHDQHEHHQHEHHQHEHHQHEHHQHQHQHHLEQDATQIPPPYSPPPTSTPLPNTSTKLSPGRTVERLAHKLSEQNLRLSPPSPDQPQTQPTRLLSSSAATGLDTPVLCDFRSWAGSEVHGQPWPHFPSASFDYHAIPGLPISTQGFGEPIEVDEEYQRKPDDRRLLDVRRPRRQTSGQLRGTSSIRPVDHRLETMIAAGTQCKVHSESRPTRPASSTASAAHPSFIEPDPECAMPSPDLEVDDPDAGGVAEPAGDVVDESISLRYASGPGGIRKYTVGGIALRYRLSADAALRCPNVVRSRPRMRRRHKTRHGDAGSSAVTSAVTSPAMSSAGSPPLPTTRLPP